MPAVTIVGAGISGLAAAYELSRRGVPFTVLEASHRAGGLIHTERIDGFTIEAGADSMLAQKPAGIALCDDLGLSGQLQHTKPPRTAFVLKGGRLHSLPSPSVLGIPTTLGALASYDLLEWRSRIRVALEPLVPRRTLADESVASFFRRRFGPATVDLVAEPLLGGIHAGDVERLSMRSLFPRLTDAEARPGKVLRNIGGGPAPRDGAFRALRSGMSGLVDTIVSALPPESITFSAGAASIARSGASTWRVVTPGRQVDSAVVIIAAPAHAAAALLSGVDQAAAQICETVPYVSTVSVALGWRREDVPHPLDGSGFVVARRHSDLRITACTWVSSKWDHRAPDGYVLVRAFFGGAHDPEAVRLSDEELVALATRDLSRVIGVTAEPALARVHRWHNAGAQHHVGHHARMAGLAARLRAHPGLLVVGSGFDSIGIPDCIANGRRAAIAAAELVTAQGGRTERLHDA